jgi:hypothetical protein
LFDEWLLWTDIEDEPFVQPNRAKVFPNPASDQITFEIKTSSGIDKLNIQIVSITGEIIEEFEFNNDPVILNISDYPAGIYLYRVYHNDRILDAGKFSVRE